MIRLFKILQNFKDIFKKKNYFFQKFSSGSATDCDIIIIIIILLLQLSMILYEKYR